MNLAEPFIRRPVATTLLVLSILIFGIMGYRLLPVSDLPTVDFPTIQVNASLPGASPETMAASVATPLEKQFSTIAGVSSISSSNTQGFTSITLQFDLSRSIDAAAQDVQSMIARAQRSLPPGMPSPPSFQKVNPADTPVLFLTLSSPTLPLAQLDRYAQNLLAQRLSMVSGVAQVSVFGSQKFAVRVDVDPMQLASRQIGIDQVAQAIAASNVNRPTGTLYGPDRNFVIETSGQLLDAAGYHGIVVAWRNGSPVRLNEVANVYAGVENERTASWYNGARTIYLAIQRQPGTNTVEVVDRIKALLPQLEQQLPASVQLRIRSDRSVPIRESVDDVKFTLQLTAVLVVLVIFLFLQERVGDDHPEPGAALLDRRDVHGDVRPRLQPRQPVADGADALGRLRRRRRHRHAGEHRPAHGDGQAAAAGRARRIEGGRVHDRLDDAVARGGLHPGALHGRRRRPADARVRRDDRRGHPRVRPRVAHADADAVQPVPESAALDRARVVVQRDGARLRRVSGAGTPGRCARRSGSRARRWSCPRCCSAARCICSRSSRWGSSPAWTPAS